MYIHKEMHIITLPKTHFKHSLHIILQCSAVVCCGLWPFQLPIMPSAEWLQHMVRPTQLNAQHLHQAVKLSAPWRAPCININKTKVSRCLNKTCSSHICTTNNMVSRLHTCIAKLHGWIQQLWLGITANLTFKLNLTPYTMWNETNSNHYEPSWIQAGWNGNRTSWSTANSTWLMWKTNVRLNSVFNIYDLYRSHPNPK